MIRPPLPLLLLACSTLLAADPQPAAAPSLSERLASLEKQLAEVSPEKNARGSGIKISGYLDVSYIANLANRDNTGPVAGSSLQNNGRVYDLQYNSFNLDALQISIQKDKDDSKFPAGFQMDGVMGDKANVLDNSASLNDSKFYLQQAFIDIDLPITQGLSLQAGKFITLLGYESADRYQNWSMSYTEAARIFPGSQTGIRFVHKPNDHLKTSVGCVNGWDYIQPQAGALNFNTDFSFEGRVDVIEVESACGTWSPAIVGYYGNDDIGSPTLNSHTIQEIDAIVLLTKAGGCEPLSLAAEYAHRRDEMTVASGPSPLEADTFSLFSKWDWNTWLSTSGFVSYSWYQNSSNSTLSPLVPHSNSTQPGASENYAFTLTQTFKVWKDAMLRFEWRHDWTHSPSVGFGTTNPNGAPDDIRQDQDTLAVNLVVWF
ncbi:MAG: outer membrane beta-barrel protein [Verrucomicrobiae bacterium]|nr:outer membrane beta-barrel protein [Verrucomicrobiae bacterium]